MDADGAVSFLTKPQSDGPWTPRPAAVSRQVPWARVFLTVITPTIAGGQVNAEISAGRTDRCTRRGKLQGRQGSQPEDLADLDYHGHQCAPVSGHEHQLSNLTLLFLERCTGSAAKFLGRFLVCLYFINIVYEDYETYIFMSSPEMLSRVRRFPERYPSPSFPYIEVFFLLPCAVLAIFDFRVPITGSILVLDMLKDSGLLIWNQTCDLLGHSHDPFAPWIKP